MLRVLSMVSGGGTNLQAIIDSVKNGMITNTELVGVISNNKNAYALTRAKENGIDAKCISPKDYESREVFNQELLKAVDAYEPDLIVLAGYLVVIPPEMIKKYKNRIINIHPSLIPSFCGTGYYGLKVHDAATPRTNGCSFRSFPFPAACVIRLPLSLFKNARISFVRIQSAISFDILPA